ncbi:hypothetical protein HK104_005408 [Borealophlyctis nickersoniae]|nr:hypothetical protein HK104_005408 [Borealophlyctis nickersoniae]
MPIPESHAHSQYSGASSSSLQAGPVPHHYPTPSPIPPSPAASGPMNIPPSPVSTMSLPLADHSARGSIDAQSDFGFYRLGLDDASSICSNGSSLAHHHYAASVPEFVPEVRHSPDVDVDYGRHRMAESYHESNRYAAPMMRTRESLPEMYHQSNASYHSLDSALMSHKHSVSVTESYEPPHYEHRQSTQSTPSASSQVTLPQYEERWVDHGNSEYRVSTGYEQQQRYAQETQPANPPYVPSQPTTQPEDASFRYQKSHSLPRQDQAPQYRQSAEHLGHSNQVQQAFQSQQSHQPYQQPQQRHPVQQQQQQMQPQYQHQQHQQPQQYQQQLQPQQQLQQSHPANQIQQPQPQPARQPERAAAQPKSRRSASATPNKRSNSWHGSKVGGRLQTTPMSEVLSSGLVDPVTGVLSSGEALTTSFPVLDKVKKTYPCPEEGCGKIFSRLYNLKVCVHVPFWHFVCFVR